MSKINQKGFTLIELLIATSVFSVILMLCTAGLIQISRVYTGGVIRTRTQEAARNAIDTISQTLQLTPGVFSENISSVEGESSSYCIGGQQISFLKNHKLTSDDTTAAGEAHHALMVHPAIAAGCLQYDINQNTAQGQELLAPNMQLASLEIDELVGGRMKLTIRVAYGDDDLFEDNDITKPCKMAVGSQFCYVSELSTIVQRRVQ